MKATILLNTPSRMTFWSDVGDFISGAAKAAGDFVETVTNAVGDAISDTAETTGNGIQDGLNTIVGWLGAIPVVGGFLAGVIAWLGDIIAGIGNYIGALIKSGFNLTGGLTGGLIKIAGGILSFDGDLVTEGLFNIWSGLSGAFIAWFGTQISFLQRLIPFINKDRSLTREEKTMLSTVFQKSLPLYNIRIKYSSGIKTGHLTMCNTIYSDLPDLAVPPHVLVHECVHVWQYQHYGVRYLSEAIGAQMVYGRTNCNPGDAYDWIAEFNRGNVSWLDFNREAQAELIEEIWTDGTLTSMGNTEVGKGAFYKKENCEAQLAMLISSGPTVSGQCEERFIAAVSPEILPNGFFIHCPRDGNDWTPLASESVAQLRKPVSFRISQIFG